MDDEEIINILNTFFKYSEDYDDYLDPDYIVSENIFHDNSLDRCDR